MNFRPIRGGLSTAMGECVCIPETMIALARHVGGNIDDICLADQGWDERIKWHSYLVLLNGVPVGYVDKNPWMQEKGIKDE